MAWVTQLSLIDPQVVVKFEPALLYRRVEMIIVALLSLSRLLYTQVNLSNPIIMLRKRWLGQGVSIGRLISAQGSLGGLTQQTRLHAYVEPRFLLWLNRLKFTEGARLTRFLLLSQVALVLLNQVTLAWFYWAKILDEQVEVGSQVALLWVKFIEHQGTL